MSRQQERLEIGFRKDDPNISLKLHTTRLLSTPMSCRLCMTGNMHFSKEGPELQVLCGFYRRSLPMSIRPSDFHDT